MTQFVACKFKPEHTRTYTYRNDGPPLKVGDLVDVETRSGIEVVEIVEAPSFECKPIIGRHVPGDKKPDQPDQPALPMDAEDIKDTPPPSGHNNPPAYDVDAHGEIKARVEKFTAAAGAWKDVKEVDSEELASKLADFTTGCRGLHGEVETMRKAQKKPHDDAGKEVQAAFTPLLDKLKKSADAAKVLHAGWLRKEQDRLEAERKKAEAEAEAKLKAAQEKAAAAESRNDISGEVDAEKELKAAEKEAKRAAKPVKATAKSASGAGRAVSLRKIRTAEIKNIRLLFMHYQEHPDIVDTLQRLADADIRRAKGEDPGIPGIEIKEKEVAV